MIYTLSMSETPTNNSDVYQLTFRNGALARLKELAQKLNIPEDNLDQVVEKGIKALGLPDDDKLRFKKGGETYFIDIRNL